MYLQDTFVSFWLFVCSGRCPEQATRWITMGLQPDTRSHHLPPTRYVGVFSVWACACACVCLVKTACLIIITLLQSLTPGEQISPPPLPFYHPPGRATPPADACAWQCDQFNYFLCVCMFLPPLNRRFWLTAQTTDAQLDMLWLLW